MKTLEFNLNLFFSIPQITTLPFTDRIRTCYHFAKVEATIMCVKLNGGQTRPFVGFRLKWGHERHIYFAASAIFVIYVFIEKQFTANMPYYLVPMKIILVCFYLYLEQDCFIILVLFLLILVHDLSSWKDHGQGWTGSRYRI